MSLDYLRRLLILGVSILLSFMICAVSPVGAIEKTKTIDQIPIIMYHNLTDNESMWNGANIPVDKFKSDMEAIKEAGYNTIHPHELVDYKEKDIALPNKPILITFDDGYLSNYEDAYPILEELGMKATIHVIGKDVGMNESGKIPRFTWKQAKEMSDSGVISIQSHTHNLHGDGVDTFSKGVMRGKEESAKDNKSRVVKDMKANIKEIEDNVGKDVVMLAYPYGMSESYTDDLVAKLGIKMTVTVRDGVPILEEGLMSMPRINSPYDMTSEELVSKINDMRWSNIERFR